MGALAERIAEEFTLGPDRPDASEREAREIILQKLTKLPISDIYGQSTFYSFTNLMDLIKESNEGTYHEMNKFDRFLIDAGLVLYGNYVKRIINKLARPAIFGREIYQNYSPPTVKDAKEWIDSGLIEKIDGFDNEFYLAIARRLFG